MITPLDLNATAIALGQYGNISSNSSNENDFFGNGPVFPPYIRTTATVICSLIMGVGVLGNIMVPIVIFKSKDMRNSTNIFLMNLSLADIMVLLVCTPTVLVEVNSRPETWVLGEEMCRAVPFIEMMVTHASVLTILAISFERYYAICEPLKAGYICTKTRAFFICLCAWFLAGLLTSPMLFISQYELAQYSDGSLVPACLTPADTFWKELFYYMSISLFFWVPLVILLLLYTIIVVRLMSDPGIKGSETFSHRGRSQLVAMLGTVVLSFFLCLMPFRVFLPWYISASAETIKNLGIEKYFNILYFCKTMSYVHSAINPVLYNLMSTKFRDGFMRVCGFRSRRTLTNRKSWACNASASLSFSRRERDSLGPDFRSKMLTTARAKTDGDFSAKLLYVKPQCLEPPRRSTQSLTEAPREGGRILRSKSDEEFFRKLPDRNDSVRKGMLKSKMQNRLQGEDLHPDIRRDADVWLPIVCMTDYSYQEYGDGSNVSVCLTLADTFWSKTYFLGGTFIFFVVPLAILVILYSMMALNLMSYPGIVSFARQDNSTSAQRYRKQVILMLGTVVLFFFISLLPFRALIVWIVLVPHEEVMALGNEKYYNLLYFCRIMFYLNSAINPILYNLMSTKFRNGFFKLCGIKKKCFRKHTRALLRNSTFNTSSLTAITTSSIHRASVVDSSGFRDRSRSVTGRSVQSEQSRQGSCSKSAGHGRSRTGIYLERTRPSRRKSFGDFQKTPAPVMNHSRSLDSVFRARRTVRLCRREVEFVCVGNHISGNEGNISRQNGLRKMANGEVERTFLKRRPTVNEIYV